MSKSTYLLVFICFSLGVSGCCISPRYQHEKRIESSQLFEAKTNHVRGATILVHGLNQRPSSLDPLAKELQALGYHSYRITLAGHERAEETVFPDSSWVKDLVKAYQTTQQRYPTLPIYVVGYSLGGLLVTHLLDTHPEIHPQAVVLVAPALSLRLLPQTGYLLTLFPPLSWAIPNIAPPYYRRFKETPLFWYRNTFTLYSATRNLRNSARLRSIPSTIFANPRDELVSLAGLQTWINDNELSSGWKIEPIRPDVRNPSIPGHVIIDERSLGHTEWKKLLTKLQSALR